MTRWESVKNKILTLDQAVYRGNMYRLKNQKIVFTNGCFDLLHVGHVNYLAEAASLGNKLIVGVNDDASVKSLLKGENRPINPEMARALVLASLGFVDMVVVFKESTPLQTILALQPDVLVKGGDYDAEETDSMKKSYIVGSNEVRQNGGTVSVIPLVPGFSSTVLLNKING